MKRSILFLLGGLLALTAVACQTAGEPQTVEVTREVTRLVEVTVPPPLSTPEPNPVVVTRLVVETQPAPAVATPAPLGSAERPIHFWSSPSSGANIGETRAAIIVDTLREVTGFEFIVHLPATDEEVVEALCADPATAMAIAPPAVYEAATEQCRAQPILTAVRFEQPWQWGMIVVRSDRGISSLADLAGRRWGVGDPESVANTRYFEALFAEQGIDVGEQVELGTDVDALLAVFAGDVDFATATYIPPILPFMERTWEYGVDDPEKWREFSGFLPERHPVGFIVVAGRPENGGYRIRDARAVVFDVQREIFTDTRILQISAPIPNDTLTFGPEFPLAVALPLAAALEAFAAGEACQQTLCSRDFYNWELLQAVDDAAFAPLRLISAQLSD